jgi:predicted dehydrogenase
VLAVCDPFQDRRQAQAANVDNRYGSKGCQAYNDFREVLARDDIDAVVIATPDHWHVPISLAAVRAGKDVYCEKPLGISIEQNKVLREAVHRHGAIFQYGTQQRSFSAHCGFACELVRNGYIGEVQAVHVVAPNGARGGGPGGLEKVATCRHRRGLLGCRGEVLVSLPFRRFPARGWPDWGRRSR